MTQLRKLRRGKARKAWAVKSDRVPGCRSAPGPDCFELLDEMGFQLPLCVACDRHESALRDSVFEPRTAYRVVT